MNDLLSINAQAAVNTSGTPVINLMVNIGIKGKKQADGSYTKDERTEFYHKDNEFELNGSHYSLGFPELKGLLSMKKPDGEIDATKINELAKKSKPSTTFENQLVFDHGTMQLGTRSYRVKQFMNCKWLEYINAKVKEGEEPWSTRLLLNPVAQSFLKEGYKVYNF